MDAPAIPILFEDNHLLVVEKPPNLPSQSDSSGDPDLLSLLKADLKQRHAKPGNVYLGMVHRLDRPVGGVMVFAKTSKAAARLSEQIRIRQFQKVYGAVIHGLPEAREGELRHFLAKDLQTNTSRVVAADHPEAKEAVLRFEVVACARAREASFALTRIRLQTGRSHQIRVQMAATGHPLYGDQKYGAARNQPGQQLALWAIELGFNHPTKNEWLRFNSAPPRIHPWNLFEGMKIFPME